MKLNKKQLLVEQYFLKFLLSEDTVFTLSGGAGVGKTFLVNHLVGDMGKYNFLLATLGKKGLTDIAITATTNKAAEVIRDSINQKVSTVHSYLGLSIFNDYKTGKTSLKQANNNEKKDTLIIIDEASMVDTELYNIINNSVTNCKIMFVGDHCQMSPISEPISPIFIKPNNVHYLTEPVRNKECPELIALCSQLRESVETGVFKSLPNIPGIITHLTSKTIEASLHNTFSKPEFNSRITAYTNQRVIQYNNHIRTSMGMPELFQIGESIVSNTNTTIDNQIRLNPEKLLVVYYTGKPYINKFLLSEFNYDIEVYDITTDVGVYPQPTNPGYLQHCMKHAASVKNWVAYFYMKEKISDFRMVHACTVYKAQGSSYDSIYIDLNNIGTCNTPDQVARMLYVAVSRARKQVFFYGELPYKYNGSN